MWRGIYHTVVGWRILITALPYVLSGRRTQADNLSRLKSRVLRLFRLLPTEIAAEELASFMQVVSPSYGVWLVQWGIDILVHKREALLTVANALQGWGEYDLAETILWRGVRLFEADREVWDTALGCSLTHILYSFGDVERQRAWYRFNYLLDALPEPLREEQPLSAYFVFTGEQGRELLDVQQFAMWLWWMGRAEEARHALSLLWHRLSGYVSVPECVSRWAGWSMLGLGLFEMMAQQPVIQNLYPAWIQVANWFSGMPLPPWGGYNTLFLLTKWAQDLVEGRRTTGVIWRALLSMSTPDEKRVFYTMLAASVGIGRAAARRRLERWLGSSGEWMFLPYLHLLCLAATRLRWEPLAWELWRRIDQFDVDYPRKTELYRYLQATFPAKQG